MKFSLDLSALPSLFFPFFPSFSCPFDCGRIFNGKTLPVKTKAHGLFLLNLCPTPCVTLLA